jgi:hypothetical protein
MTRQGRDSKVEKWLRWVDGPIKNEILTMNLHRSCYRELVDLAQKKALPDSYFWEYLQDTYSTTQAIAIRRQAETSSRVRTLGRLIAEAQEDANRLTREWWVGLWHDIDEPSTRQFAEGAFNQQFGGAIGDHLDPSTAQQDLDLLADNASKVNSYVDQHVAHADARAATTVPTFADVDAVIDTIGDLFTKYANLLTASTWGTLVPVFQHDWLAPFRVPWL